MRKLQLLLGAMAFALCACDAPAPKRPSAPEPRPTPPPVAEAPTHEKAPNGKEIYEARCASCHAIEGTGALGPKTNLKASPLDSAQIHQVIAHGRPEKGMMGFGSILDSTEIDSLVEYVHKFQSPSQQ